MTRRQSTVDKESVISMKRILVHIPMMPHGEYDIFSQQDHRALLQIVNKKLGGICPNVGNRLWFQGLMSEIESAGNALDFFSPDMSKEQINAAYDFIIAPMANVFSANYRSVLERLEARFRGIRIPVYVIACGIQADSYDQLDEICAVLKEPASRFISSVYDTGGQFALRGHFTAEFFHRLGFDSAVVTGCPSLYQLGRNLRVSDGKVDRHSFRPLLNGDPTQYKTLFKTHKNAEFFDQSTYYRELWDPDCFTGSDSDIRDLVKRYGCDTASLLLHDRIKLIPGMNDWREYLIREQFSMSYGSRIHGSIMPILAGIPAVLETRDARTREMAEFFEIPCTAPDAHLDYESLYELYQQISYDKFNAGFAARFDAYEAFLKKYGIVEHINENNRFFHPLENAPQTSVNAQQRKILAAKMDRQKALWIGYDKLRGAKHRLTAHLR